jgi:hypothetical protein
MKIKPGDDKILYTHEAILKMAQKPVVKEQCTLKIINYINYFGKISGSTFVNIWGVVALIKFILGQPIDWSFLGIIGIYTTHKLTSKFISNGDSNA